MSFFGRGSRKLQRLFAREDHSRACLIGHKPIDPLATQLVLENNWPRVPVEQSGEASDMMRTGPVPARQPFGLIRLSQRKVVSPWPNFPRSLESPQTSFGVIPIYFQLALLSGVLVSDPSHR